MQREPHILIHHLSYSIPDTAVCFDAVTLNFTQKRYGIIGDNGVGKTTLLKLILQEIVPQQGSIQCQGDVLYCPQNYEPKDTHETIAETLGISEKLQALSRIQNGELKSEDYELIDNDWDLQARAQQWLAVFDLENIDWNRPFLSLSGGQQTKILLIRAFLSNADFILFDEPTNNLDQHSRAKLYEWIRATKKGLLIVSHDRTLLNMMDEMIEITTKGVHRYGGKYDFYVEQKALQHAALERKLFDAKQKVQQTEQSVQDSREKLEQRRKQGKTLRKAGKIDKMTAKSKQGRSEKTQSRNTIQADHMQDQAEALLETVKSQIEIKESIHADLSATRVPNGKLVLAIEDLCFAYPHEKKLFDHFCLTITGPERIALTGKNGAGKTTLIQLILGELQPDSGKIFCGVHAICYLDQSIRFLDYSLSVLENFQKLNPEITTRDAYFALASFNFRNKDAEKIVSNLSGGERIRAGLAIRLLSKKPPQLILLDEPTNHLDIRSIEAIEEALRAYEGAMIVISHDQEFLENVGVEGLLKL